MAEPGALMAAEIAEQPTVLDHAARSDVAAFDELRQHIARFDPRFVMLAARGTSDHAALYAKYLVEVHWQRAAGLVSPSTLTLYGARPDLRQVLFIAVSQSGASPDLVGSLEVARSCGALTIAITNTADSPLARAAEHHVDIHAGPELAVAATKSYTAQLLAVYRLIVGDDVGALGEAAARTLDGGARVEDAGARWQDEQHFVLTGRGYSYPTAREGALKLMETSYVPALAFSAADLVHGPLAMVGAGTPVIAIRTPGPGGAAMTDVLDRLAGVGADVLVVGDPAGLPLHLDGIPPALIPVLEILPLQQLAWRLALGRGNDPDRPRGLSKVTQTW